MQMRVATFIEDVSVVGDGRTVRRIFAGVFRALMDRGPSGGGLVENRNLAFAA